MLFESNHSYYNDLNRSGHKLEKTQKKESYEKWWISARSKKVSRGIVKYKATRNRSWKAGSVYT